MWCKSRFLVLTQMLPNKDANVIFMMQMFPCKVFPWWCQCMQMFPYRDGDAKCLVVQMFSNGHVMMQMLLAGMSWCKCPCRYAMMQMPRCGYIMTWMLWSKHNLFKNSLYFQNEASLAPETKMFSKTWFIIHEKSSFFFFYLRLPKTGDHC